MLDTAKRHLEQKRGYQVLAAVLSPTSDVQLRKKFWEKDGFLSNKGNVCIASMNEKLLIIMLLMI